MFSVHTTTEKFKRAKITGHFGFVLGQGDHIIIMTPLFSQSSIFKMFFVHKKTQSRHFQIPPV